MTMSKGEKLEKRKSAKKKDGMIKGRIRYKNAPFDEIMYRKFNKHKGETGQTFKDFVIEKVMELPD